MRSAVGLWKWKIIAVTAAAVMAAVFAVSASAATQTKVALIIGNGAYKGVPELTNPTNDATAVAGAFLRLGFSVRLVTDASYDDMRPSAAGVQPEGARFRNGDRVLCRPWHRARR